MRFRSNKISRYRNLWSAMVVSFALVACGGQVASPTLQPATNTPETIATATTASITGKTDMAHGGMNMNAPYDAQFIDSMIVHHQGAVDMAKQAKAEAQRPEIKTLAEDIIKSQQAEIDQMKQWRSTWYPDLKENVAMPMDMSTMMISTDSTIPFDIRFINAMIPHHESAIVMSQEAQQRAEHTEIKKLADDIIKAQQTEISQMRQWLTDWGQGK